MTRPHPVAADRDAHLRLGRHLLAAVRAQDAAIPAHRRVPRTVAEMQARLEERMAQLPTMAEDACPLCGFWRCRCDEVLKQAPTTPARATGCSPRERG